MAETTGNRLYLIRLACGDGVRRPESLRAFAARVKKQTGEHYDPMTVSLLERMGQAWKLDDINTFAAVDPRERGAAWLAWGEVAPEPVRSGDQRVSDEEIAKAHRETDARRLAEKTRAVGGGKRGRKR